LATDQGRPSKGEGGKGACAQREGRLVPSGGGDNLSKKERFVRSFTDSPGLQEPIMRNSNNKFVSGRTAMGGSRGEGRVARRIFSKNAKGEPLLGKAD